METGQEYLKAQRNGQSFLLLTYQRMVSSSASRDKTRGKTRTQPNWKPQKVSESPTTVVTANGEVQTEEEATVYVKDLDLFVTVKLLEDTLAVLSLGKLVEDLIFLPLDQWSATTTHRRWQTDKIQHCEQRTDRCPWFIDRLLKLSYTFISNISLRSESSSGPAQGDPSSEPEENQNHIKMRTPVEYGATRCVICPNGWEEFKENLVDESVPEHRDAPASSSRESASELRGKVVSGKTQYFISLPEGPELRHMQEHQDYKGTLQKTHWHSHTSCGKLR